MKKINACFPHKSGNWSTPSAIYNFYMAQNYFDPCPLNSDFDGLTMSWKDKNFVNPPYSQLSKWVDKAISEAKLGKHIIMLIPSRTDTQYFKKLYQYGALFIFITGRLCFGNKKNAPFPSVLVMLASGPIGSLSFMAIRERSYYESKSIK